LLDLHNCASLGSFEYAPGELRFLFRYSCGDDLSPSDTLRHFLISFSPVRQFQIEQIEGGEGNEADALSHITYSPSSPGWGWFQLYFMDGMEVTFQAGSVRLQEMLTERHWDE
jgi:hypothetical protein